MNELKRARKAFTKAYIRAQGHLEHEFQGAKSLETSKRVADRNREAVRSTASNLGEVCDRRIAKLEKQIGEAEMMKYHLREMSYYPKNSSYGMEDSFPEIQKGLDKYADRYYDRKYNRRKK